MDIFAEPELGFKEQKTSAKVKAVFDQLGMNYSDGWGITGVKARVKGRQSKKTIALLGELDAIICRDHPNCDPYKSVICWLWPWPLRIPALCSISMVM